MNRPKINKRHYHNPIVASLHPDMLLHRAIASSRQRATTKPRRRINIKPQIQATQTDEFCQTIQQERQPSALKFISAMSETAAIN